MSPQQLPTRQLGRDGPQVPQIGFGLMELSTGYVNTAPSEAERFEVLDKAWEIGATFWDTAAGYGDNEVLVGKWFKKHPERRHDVFIATKFGFRIDQGEDGKQNFVLDSSPENCRRGCEQSLQNFGVDCIDLFYVHRFDRVTPVEKTMETLAELRSHSKVHLIHREGKIKYIGLCEASSDTVRRAYAIHPVTAVQIEYNPWSLDIETEAGTNLLATCRELGVAIVAYSPLGRGFLSGKFKSLQDLGPEDKRHGLPRFGPDNFTKNVELAKVFADMAVKKKCTSAQLALAWLMAQGQGDVFPIPGTKTLKYLEQNVGSVQVNVSPEDDKHIRETIKSLGGASGSRQVAQGNSLADTAKLH